MVAFSKKDNFRAEKLAKSANYARSAFFRKYMKIMLLNRNDDGNCAKNYASTIYRSFIFTLYALFFGPLLRAFSNRRVFDDFCQDRKPKHLEMYPCF